MLVVCLLIFASYIGRLRSLSALDQQLATAQLTIEQELARKQALLDEQSRQQDQNGEEIDQSARRDLDLVQPGDYTFTVMTPVPSTLPQTALGTESENVPQLLSPTKPIWQQWLELLIPI